MLTSTIRLGIDLGGTKIEIIALDDAGKELYRQRSATPQGDYNQTLQSICDLIWQAETTLNTQATIGICTPGALSPSHGYLRNSNSVCLNQKPFLQDIQQRLQRDVRIANDANCFALSEAIDGNGQHAEIVFGVIIGTGCGGGIVINKTLIDGPNAITGEWGHNALPNANNKESTECWCGKKNCIETYISGPGLAHDYLAATGKVASPEQIISQANEGNEEALSCLARYESRLARSLASVINLLDPHVIVLGGGMSNVKRLYDNVPALWQQHVFSDTVLTKLLPPKHGDSSGVRGAAWLWNT